MRRTIRPIVLGLTMSASLVASGVLAGERASVAGASEAAAPAAKTCLEAEVKPVTDHALCLNPLGARSRRHRRHRSFRASPIRTRTAPGPTRLGANLKEKKLDGVLGVLCTKSPGAPSGGAAFGPRATADSTAPFGKE